VPSKYIKNIKKMKGKPYGKTIKYAKPGWDFSHHGVGISYRRSKKCLERYEAKMLI
jgi:hypothetical protein